MGIIQQMLPLSKESPEVTANNVYQEANKTLRPFIYQIIQDLLLPGSDVWGWENLIELKKLAEEGKSCLILMEHYSNFDLPNLFYLLEKKGELGQNISDSIIAIAGFKLNTENHLVRAFTEAFSRIVIYPSRSLASITDQKRREQEEAISRAINLASMRALTKVKSEGKIVLIFPAGTRYRIGVPETKKGVKEVDSYLKSFDYFVPISINGNILHINPIKGMDEDLVQEDVVIFKVGPVTSCSVFRDEIVKSVSDEQDPKQAVVDRVMEVLEQIHLEVEQKRQTMPGVQPQEPDFSTFLSTT
jgi:glycerol-3-phosphate O-acyltransferase